MDLQRLRIWLELLVETWHPSWLLGGLWLRSSCSLPLSYMQLQWFLHYSVYFLLWYLSFYIWILPCIEVLSECIYIWERLSFPPHISWRPHSNVPAVQSSAECLFFPLSRVQHCSPCSWAGIRHSGDAGGQLSSTHCPVSLSITQTHTAIGGLWPRGFACELKIKLTVTNAKKNWTEKAYYVCFLYLSCVCNL